MRLPKGMLFGSLFLPNVIEKKHGYYDTIGI